jgi:hypothetical protein
MDQISEFDHLDLATSRALLAAIALSAVTMMYACIWISA